MPDDSTLTLNEAAVELGVHYMTAYRYVRLGQLDARKVGGVWQVERSALDEFRSGMADRQRVGGQASSGDETETDAAGDELVERGDGSRVPRSRRAPWARRLEARLIAGDAGGAWNVIEAAMTAGTDVREVYLDLIAPAMVGIGERWHRGEIDISVEHRASVIVMRLIGRMGARTARRGRSRGTVVVGTPAGEYHSLPTAILGDLLRLEGWEVSDIGANVPTESLLFAIGDSDAPVAVGLSATAPESAESLSEACVAIKRAYPELLVVVGGRVVRDREHAIELGADEFAQTAEDVSRLIAEHIEGQSESVS